MRYNMNGNKPFISIVMPLYNKELDVYRALNSALAQSFGNFELIVVNDGSTDRGPEIVQRVVDQRVMLINQDNEGVSAARNRGIYNAKADLIAFLDADDEWLPEFLATIIHLKTQYSDCAVFATNYRYRDANGRFRKPIYRGMPSMPWEGVLENYFELASQSDPPLWSSAVAVKKEALLAINGFPLGVTSGEDLLTWARLAARFPIAYCATPLATFWLRTADSDIPTRIPETTDNVGRKLIEIIPFLTGKKKAALYHYIGWWHKNRASMFLRLGLQKAAKREVHQMVCYSRKDHRLLLYIIMVYTPVWLTSWLLKCVRAIRTLRNFRVFQR